MFKKLHLTLFTLLFAVGTAFAAIGTPIVPAEQAVLDPAVAAMFAADGKQFTEADFLALTPKKFKNTTGERLGLKKSLMLKAAQVAMKKQAKKAKKAGLSEDAGGDKNQLVALLLAFFLGGFGIHSFYQGKTLKGIAQIVLLLGFFLIIPLILLSIWLLYDLITIAIGSQTPKNGSWNPAL